jgi:acyl phosphate:glycerol-3-phosphate acyltransferase
MVVAAIAGYLIGSIPFAVIVGKMKGYDPRNYGDGNPGWWNSRAVFGNALASIVLVGDVAKGALAAYVGTLIWGPWWTAFDALFFAMIGHAFPIFARMRGGKSILTFVGGMMILSPEAGAIAIGIGVLVGLMTRKFEYGARLAMFAFPFVQAFFDPATHVAWTGVMMTFIGLRFVASGTPVRASGEPA